MLSDTECKEILKQERRGVLAVNGDDGYPYALPINFYYDEMNGKSYGHGIFILMEDMDADKRDIRRNLEKRSEAGLNRVNEWCKLCSSCARMNEEMLQGDEQLGDDAISRKR